MPLLHHRLKFLFSLVTTIYTFSLLVSSSNLRKILLALFSPYKNPVNFSILLTSLLLNFKSIPLIWHVRIFGSMIRRLYLPQRTHYSKQIKPQTSGKGEYGSESKDERPDLPVDALFRPIVVTGFYTSLFETDWNMHKSNSTYFSDLDVARTHLFTRLLRKGILESGKARYESPSPSQGSSADSTSMSSTNSYNTSNGSTIPSKDPVSEALPEKPAPNGAPIVPNEKSDDEIFKLMSHPSIRTAPFTIGLGGITCTFKKEIKPYEPYDIYTRMLSWDRKWFYMVSYMVKPGCIPKPPGLSTSITEEDKKNQLEAQREKMRKSVFAISVAKYVVKKGRLTMPPEGVLQRSCLLPQKPSSDSLLSSSAPASKSEPKPKPDGSSNNPTNPITTKNWTWHNVEKERKRGMSILQKGFADMDIFLHDEFPVPFGVEEFEGIVGRDVDWSKEEEGLGSFVDLTL